MLERLVSRPTPCAAVSIVAQRQTRMPDFWGFELALPIASCVTLCRLLNLSVPQFLPLENGVNNSFPTKSRWEMGRLSGMKL